MSGFIAVQSSFSGQMPSCKTSLMQAVALPNMGEKKEGTCTMTPGINKDLSNVVSVKIYKLGENASLWRVVNLFLEVTADCELKSPLFHRQGGSATCHTFCEGLADKKAPQLTALRKVRRPDQFAGDLLGNKRGVKTCLKIVKRERIM